MKNETYIRNRITKLMVLPSGLGFSQDDIKKATQDTLSLIDRAVESGKINYVDEKVLNDAVHYTLDKYF